MSRRVSPVEKPSLWARKKREYILRLKAQIEAEEKFVIDIVGIAAKYIQTEYLYDFTTEVRNKLRERHNVEPPL
jgi:hypothetical protein